ncbi:MAG: glyoxylate/hydroxypyruvate reductase A [Rhodobacteraceae bacterium]|jgi:glyoxylate/hydroxypyruvate reductase A|nr:glyoxylate/hydroxypyruvate reductase A [Paracoccaceae bacterium]
MTLRVFFGADPRRWPKYAGPVREALAEIGIDAEVTDAAPDPAAVDYIITSPGGVILDYRPFSRAKAVLNLFAGVENLLSNPTLVQPLCRMVDPAMTQSMAEWVTGHVLRHHLGMDAHVLGQDGVWRNQIAPPLAAERPVGILGLGELGQAAGQMLAGVGFPVTGWSRRPKSVPGIASLSGGQGLVEVLGGSDIIVLLLPLTKDTENLLDAGRLALMPAGAVIVNAARGGLIDDAALLAALDSGRIGHATLDAFRTEPLPPEHPYWQHPRVTVTPHIAAETRPGTAARVLAENIRRGEAGMAYLHQVDRARGY